ncbi:ceramide glucosyltransferase-like [Liolophura sinensis]|uniref:ceramide glucosyltransferase-like n=1 Tax=Liolophura sinensis TaxID=3198878 RepID=UPI00315928AB
MSVGRGVALTCAIILMVLWCAIWCVHLLALFYGKWRLHYTPPVSPEDLQGVSIIKPLTGVDPHLYINLETFFKLKYPAYELLFCVQDDSDPAILVVQSLIAKYPKVDAKLFIGVKIVGPNGKINNMIRAYEASKYDLIVVSDSNLRMNDDTLTDMVASLSPKVGLVHQMPYVCDRKGFAAVYEKVYFGTQQARNYLSANCAGVNCTTGMSCLMRKDVLEEAGGMAAFGKYLAEDYFFAEAFREKGYSTVISGQPALQNCGSYSVDSFHQRLIRWARLRSSMIPVIIILEPITECMLMGVLTSWAAQYLFSVSPLAFFLLHVLCWFLIDYMLMRVIENGPLKISKFEFLVAWLLRESMALYLTMRAHSTSKIVWRNRKYRVRWGGLAEEV